MGLSVLKTRTLLDRLMGFGFVLWLGLKLRLGKQSVVQYEQNFFGHAEVFLEQFFFTPNSHRSVTSQSHFDLKVSTYFDDDETQHKVTNEQSLRLS